MTRDMIEKHLKQALPLFDAGKYTADQAARTLELFLGDAQTAKAIRERVKSVTVDTNWSLKVKYAG